MTNSPGWSDWADVEERDHAVRRAGLVHAAANATATALMAGSYLARKRGARGRGKAAVAGRLGFTASGRVVGRASELHARGWSEGERVGCRDAGDGVRRVRMTRSVSSALA